MYLPSAEHRTGQSMLVLPGGGYSMVSTPKEGHRPAQFLAVHGIAAAVLEYRHAPQEYPVPLLDAQRALRLLRKWAGDQDGLATDQVGVMGFSAGGHLAGMTATQASHPEGVIGDDLDSVSCTPNFFAIIYSVVSMALASHYMNAVCRKNLLGPEPDEELAERVSIEKAVTADTPRCFIAHEQFDPAVSIENSIQLYRALTEAGVSSTLHAYPGSTHGSGLGANLPWGRDLLEWLAAL